MAKSKKQKKVELTSLANAAWNEGKLETAEAEDWHTIFTLLVENDLDTLREYLTERFDMNTSDEALEGYVELYDNLA